MNSSDTNNTLIEEIVQLLIQEKANAFPKILSRIWNQAMIVERDTHTGAKAYERSVRRITRRPAG